MIRSILLALALAGVSSAAQAQIIPSRAAVILPQATTGTAIVAKSTAGGLYGYSFTQGATAGYFAILDATAIPAASAAITPIECVPVAATPTPARGSRRPMPSIAAWSFSRPPPARPTRP
jgi:hypothetical protein